MTMIQRFACADSTKADALNEAIARGWLRADDFTEFDEIVESMTYQVLDEADYE